MHFYLSPFWLNILCLNIVIFGLPYHSWLYLGYYSIEQQEFTSTVFIALPLNRLVSFNQFHGALATKEYTPGRVYWLPFQVRD